MAMTTTVSVICYHPLCEVKGKVRRHLSSNIASCNYHLDNFRHKRKKTNQNMYVCIDR